MTYPVTLELPADTKAALVSEAVTNRQGKFLLWRRLWRREGDKIVATYPDRFTLACALLLSGVMTVEEIMEAMENENQPDAQDRI